MADANGNNSRFAPGAPFNTPFPALGIAAGALDSTGTNMVPLNVDGSGNLKIAGSFTASLGGTTAVNITQVGNTAVTLGQAVMATSFPVVIASDQSAIPVTGSFSATNPAVGTTGNAVPASGDFIAINVAGNLQGLTGVAVVNATAYAGRFDLSSFNGTALTIGQQVMTASIPVVLASNQSNLTTVLGAALPAGTNAIGTVSVTQALPAGTNALGTVTALQSGTWTSSLAAGSNAIGTVSITQPIPGGTNAIGTVSAFQLGTWAVNLTQVGGTTLTFGQAVMATSIPVAIASNQSTLSVAGTLTAVISGTPPFNLAQVGATAISLGQKVSATSLPVVIASDQSNVTTVLGAALPGGTNAIGTVSITQPLPAGTNALGTVSITQALPAGTNALGTVTALQAGTWTSILGAGTNAVGTVSAIQTGTWTAVLAAGTNAVGTVSAIQSGTWTVSNAAGSNAIGTVSALQSGVWTAIVLSAATANMTTANASSTTTGAVTVIAALATGTAIYVGSIQFSNSGTVASVITLSDIAGSKFLVTGGGVSNVIFGVPLRTNPHSALTITCSAVSTTVFCNAQAWGGP